MTFLTFRNPHFINHIVYDHLLYCYKFIVDCRVASLDAMNLFGCLFPCALDNSWWSIGNDNCMTEEYLQGRMGVNASNMPAVGDPAATGQPSATGGPLGDGMSPAGYRHQLPPEQLGVVVRERKKKMTGTIFIKYLLLKLFHYAAQCPYMCVKVLKTKSELYFEIPNI